MKKIIILFIVLIAIVSCTKKVTEYKDLDPDTWKIDNRLIFNVQDILNTRSSNDTLFFQTPDGCGFINSSNTDYLIMINYDYYYNRSKVHMNPSYTFGVLEGNKRIQINWTKKLGRPLRYYHNGSSLLYFKPAFLDSTFSENATITTAYFAEYMSSNGSNQFIFFFNNSSSKDSDTSGTFFCLVDFIIPYPQESEPRFEVTRFSIKKVSDYLDHVSSLYFHNGKYYCNVGNNISITNNGDIEAIPIHYEIEDIFYYNDKLWALSSLSLWNSEDGVNWTEAGYTISYNVKFFVFDGKLCAYKNSLIWEVDLDNLKITSLDTSGLDYHSITSINSVQDKAYVSTTGGLYYKDKSEFFQPSTDKGSSKEGVLKLTKK